jgi:DNA polymerase-3 subunit delta'
MARALEHPDIHWYFPLERPKGVSGERLADALETDRMRQLAEVRADSLRSSYSDKVRGVYVGTVRNIRARAHKRPSMARGPVFIVGDADLLVPQESSQEAANALLKLLEEPPGAAHFVLTSSEPGLLLPTIRSRTVPLYLGPLADDLVAGFLEERCGVDAESAARAAMLGRGAIGRALGFLDETDGKGPLEILRRDALDLVTAATSGQTSSGYRVALAFPPARARTLIDLFSFVEEWIRDFAAVASGADDVVFNRDALPHLKKHVRERGIAAVDVPVAFSKVEGARELARGNVNPQLVVSHLVRELAAALVTLPTASPATR